MSLNIKQKNLLHNLLADEKKVDKKLYSAGTYWNYKTKKILFWLKKKGLNNFRGSDSGVGTSYTDNIVKDIRNELGYKGRLLSNITYLPFVKKIFNGQIRITSNHIESSIKKNKVYYQNHERVNYLISKYKIEKSTNFGCESKFKFKEKEFSTHCLNMCDRIDKINKFIKLSEISSYFEIGGGFGSNIHLLLDNFENIKKIIYVDMVSNIFVGTEYLRSFFGDAVKDYNLIRNKENIEFLKNDELEIICIPPWKIENIVSKVDHFHNAASFQEMSELAVKNYFNSISRLLNKDSLSLIVYKSRAKNETLSSAKINNIFENKLLTKAFSDLEQHELLYLISK